MTDFILYISVFIGAAIPVLEVWIAVPLGVMAGLPWFPAAIAGFLGNFLSLLPIIYASRKIKDWLNKFRKQRRSEALEVEDKPGRKHKIVEKFGVPGLAFLGPFLIGVHAAAAFAITMGASKRNVLFWFGFSLLVCSLLFGFLASVGVTEFAEGRELPFT